MLHSRAIWATSIQHLNDTSEFFYALRILQDLLEARLSTELHSPEKALVETFLKVAGMKPFPVVGYVFSMSEDPDVLSQWRAYGRPGNGYALGFDAIRLRRSLDPRGYFLAPCRYEQGQQEDLLDLIIETAFDEYREREGAPGLDANQNRKVTGVSFGLLLLQAASLIKSPAFREEREWRLVRSGPRLVSHFGLVHQC